MYLARVSTKQTIGEDSQRTHSGRYTLVLLRSFVDLVNELVKHLQEMSRNEEQATREHELSAK